MASIGASNSTSKSNFGSAGSSFDPNRVFGKVSGSQNIAAVPAGTAQSLTTAESLAQQPTTADLIATAPTTAERVSGELTMVSAIREHEQIKDERALADRQESSEADEPGSDSSDSATSPTRVLEKKYFHQNQHSAEDEALQNPEASWAPEPDFNTDRWREKWTQDKVPPPATPGPEFIRKYTSLGTESVMHSLRLYSETRFMRGSSIAGASEAELRKLAENISKSDPDTIKNTLPELYEAQINLALSNDKLSSTYETLEEFAHFLEDSIEASADHSVERYVVDGSMDIGSVNAVDVAALIRGLKEENVTTRDIENLGSIIGSAISSIPNDIGQLSAKGYTQIAELNSDSTALRLGALIGANISEHAGILASATVDISTDALVLAGHMAADTLFINSELTYPGLYSAIMGAPRKNKILDVQDMMNFSKNMGDSVNSIVHGPPAMLAPSVASNTMIDSVRSAATHMSAKEAFEHYSEATQYDSKTTINTTFILINKLTNAIGEQAASPTKKLKKENPVVGALKTISPEFGNTYEQFFTASKQADGSYKIRVMSLALNNYSLDIDTAEMLSTLLTGKSSFQRSKIEKKDTTDGALPISLTLGKYMPSLLGGVSRAQLSQDGKGVSFTVKSLDDVAKAEEYFHNNNILNSSVMDEIHSSTPDSLKVITIDGGSYGRTGYLGAAGSAAKGRYKAEKFTTQYDLTEINFQGVETTSSVEAISIGHNPFNPRLSSIRPDSKADIVTTVEKISTKPVNGESSMHKVSGFTFEIYNDSNPVNDQQISKNNLLSEVTLTIDPKKISLEHAAIIKDNESSTFDKATTIQDKHRIVAMRNLTNLLRGKGDGTDTSKQAEAELIKAVSAENFGKERNFANVFGSSPI